MSIKQIDRSININQIERQIDRWTDIYQYTVCSVDGNMLK